MLLLINLNTNVILEAKNHLIFSKTSILLQKFKMFCKIWVAADAGYLWFNYFYFVTVISTIRHCLLVFFCDKFINSSTFVLDKSFNCRNSLSYGVTHSLISLNKSCNDKASQIDISYRNSIIQTAQPYCECFDSIWFWIRLIIKHT